MLSPSFINKELSKIQVELLNTETFSTQRLGSAMPMFPDTCDRQRLGQELHWWRYSQKCVGLVCPPQLP